MYHICHEKHIDNVNEGYIGVTRYPSRRKYQHFSALSLNSHKNRKLQKAYNECSANAEELQFSIFREFDGEADAYRLEESLRPVKNTAWNIAVGGVRVYDDRFKKKEHNVVDNDFLDIELIFKDIQIEKRQPNWFVKILRSLFVPIRDRYRIASAALILKNLMDATWQFDQEDTRKYSNLILCQTWAKRRQIFNGSFGNEPHRIATALYCLAEYTVTNELSIDEKMAFSIICGNLIEQIIANGKLYGLNNVDVYLSEQGIYHYLTLNEQINSVYSFDLLDRE